MTIRQLISGAQRLVAGVVLGLSGAYLIIYLYRWEWNRAIISGLFFVAAEVALATSMITRRLRAIERRQQSPPEQSSLVLRRLRSTPVERPDPFAWLKSTSSRGTGVFVPVLLGAGVVLSALAYVVERVAEATALPVLDRHLARELSTLAPPPGGLLGGPPSPPTADTKRRAPGRLMATALAAAAITVVGWLGVQTLIEATQTRPDPADRPGRTTIELAVAQRGTGDGATEAAEALWVGCRSTLGSLATTADVVGLGGDRVAVVLEPGIGELSTRRLTGCLTDLRVNLVRADVLHVDDAG